MHPFNKNRIKSKNELNLPPSKRNSTEECTKLFLINQYLPKKFKFGYTSSTLSYILTLLKSKIDIFIILRIIFGKDYVNII